MALRGEGFGAIAEGLAARGEGVFLGPAEGGRARLPFFPKGREALPRGDALWYNSGGKSFWPCACLGRAGSGRKGLKEVGPPVNQNANFQKERGVQRLPSWMLILLTGALVAAALLFLLVPWMQSGREQSGYLTPAVLVDGQTVEAPERLLYHEGDVLYLSAQQMAKLVPGVQLSHDEYWQTPALQVFCTQIGCSAAVLEDGKIAGTGTHAELLDTCPAYQEIYYSQFPKEVASNG